MPEAARDAVILARFGSFSLLLNIFDLNDLAGTRIQETKSGAGSGSPARRAPQSGMTAVISISTLASSSTRPATWTAVIAGKLRPMTSR